MKRGHLHGAHDDLEARVVLDEEDDAVVEPHRGRRVERRLAVQLNVVRLSPVGQREIGCCKHTGFGITDIALFV